MPIMNKYSTFFNKFIKVRKDLSYVRALFLIYDIIFLVSITIMHSTLSETISLNEYKSVSHLDKYNKNSLYFDCTKPEHP